MEHTAAQSRSPSIAAVESLDWGCVFPQGDVVMPQLIILQDDLKAGKVVICRYSLLTQ